MQVWFWAEAATQLTRSMFTQIINKIHESKSTKET